MDDKLTDLQTQLTFQDDTIEQLNRVVIDQQQELLAIRQELAQLQGLLKDLKRNLPAAEGEESPPPHY